MKIITFSGVDGSGKSTQLQLLRNMLESEGRKVAYFHAIEFSLANRFSQFLRGNKTFILGEAKAVTHASALSLVIRQKLLFVDLFRFSFLRRRLEHKGYAYLVSDRYFYDTLLNLEYLALPHKGSPLLFLWEARRRFLEYFITRPDAAFYMRVSSESILSRARVPEQGEKYLQEKISLFEKYAPHWGMRTIHGELAAEAIAQEIAQSIV